jgi:chromosome partitioning protein
MIITFASSKGGVGKSTACAFLAGKLCSRHERVHIIDLDQNRALDRWLKQQGATPIQGLSVSTIDPDQLSNHIKKLGEQELDYILIDCAGAYEKALMLAIMRSNLVIIPTKASELDMKEAMKVIADIDTMSERFKADIAYRLLISQVNPLNPAYQQFTLDEIERLGFDRFMTVIHERAAYREIFLTGKPPHFADPKREAVRKAVAEIDNLTDEIDTILASTVAEQQRAAS